MDNTKLDLEHPYLDPQRFPLTTQKGLNLREQKMIDAVNKDDLRRMKEDGASFTPRQESIWQEFEAKAKLLAGPRPAVG
jgi:hypothetical protein